MAVVSGNQFLNELGTPNRFKAVRIAANSQTRKRGVDEPQLLANPGHLVDLDVAGRVAATRQKASVVSVSWF